MKKFNIMNINNLSSSIDIKKIVVPEVAGSNPVFHP